MLKQIFLEDFTNDLQKLTVLFGYSIDMLRIVCFRTRSSTCIISEIESAHNPEIHGIEDSIVEDIKDNIGGSAGEIITALRCKLKDVELQTSKSKCLICMVSSNIVWSLP